MAEIAIIVGVLIIIIAAGIMGSFYIYEDKEPSTNTESSQEITISDSVEISKNSQNFIIDEDGNKKYFITASDAPDLND